jgi:hypothetical protein
MDNDTRYRKALLLVTYYDRSELLYLTDEKRYVWMRPNDDCTKMFETRIAASKHREAIVVVRRRIHKEYEKSLTKRWGK